MINIASFKVLKGYEHWKTVFMDEEFVKRREEAGVKILAKGFDAQNDRVYVVQELDSMEVIQNAMAKNQEKIKEAGVDMSTMQMIPLQDWFKQRFFPGLENQNEEFGEKGSHFNQGSNFTKDAIIKRKDCNGCCFIQHPQDLTAILQYIIEKQESWRFSLLSP